MLKNEIIVKLENLINVLNWSEEQVNNERKEKHLKYGWEFDFTELDNSECEIYKMEYAKHEINRILLEEYSK